MKAIAYTRVSTEGQAEGLSLKAQRETIEAAAKHRGWQLTVIEDAGESGTDEGRPGLREALEMIAANEAEALMVARLDRLSRSAVHTGQLLEWFGRADAAFVALDMDIDTSTPSGILVAGVLAHVAQWEGSAIASRTSAALQSLKAEGKPVGPPAVPAKIRARISRQRKRGLTFQRIADLLNHDQIPTARGAPQWRANAVATANGYRGPRHRRRVELPSLDGRSRKATA